MAFYKKIDSNDQIICVIQGETRLMDDDAGVIVEITKEEYEAVISAMLEPDETKGAEDDGE